MKKVIYKVFFVWNEDDEIRFLEEKAKEGWLLETALPFRYTFKKVEGDDYTYQFDYSNLSESNYREKRVFLESCGWTYVTRLLGWHYYRAKTSMLTSKELYTDQESLKEKYSQLMRLFVIIGILNLFSFFNMSLLVSRHGWSGAGLVNLGCSLLMLYAFIKTHLRIKNFKNRIG